MSNQHDDFACAIHTCGFAGNVTRARCVEQVPDCVRLPSKACVVDFIVVHGDARTLILRGKHCL